MSKPVFNSLSHLQPARDSEVKLYAPYYHKDKHALLPLALSLYSIGNLEGKRRIEGGEGIPFVASWLVAKLPSDLTRCRLQFEGQADLSYEITISNSEFVDRLMETIKISTEAPAPDFSQKFYRKLLRFDVAET
jgi:hypothetical protein